MDIGVTKDGVLVMSHNRQVNGVHCHDTAPVTPGDPLFPYAGKNIKDLTLAQIKTLDCGFTDPGFPKQIRQPGEKMPTLQEVFDLVAARGDTHVRFNIETKISPLVERHRALRRHDGQARQGDRGQRPAGPGHDPVLRLAHDHAVQAARSAHRHGRAHLAVLGRRLRQPRRRVLARGGRRATRRSSARGPTAWTGGSSATWASS